MITAEVFFTVFNERGVFIKQLKVVSKNAPPTFNNERMIFEPENEVSNLLNGLNV